MRVFFRSLLLTLLLCVFFSTQAMAIVNGITSNRYANRRKLLVVVATKRILAANVRTITKIMDTIMVKIGVMGIVYGMMKTRNVFLCTIAFIQRTNG